MMPMPKADLDESELIAAYRDQQLSLRQIAAQHGVAHVTVMRHLVARGVVLRSKVRARRAYERRLEA